MKLKHLFSALLIAVAFIVTPVLAQGPSGDSQAVFFDPALKEHLMRAETAPLIIQLRGQADLSPAFEMDWIERGRFVYNELSTFNARAQADLLADLDAQGIEYQAFWIANIVSVPKANMTTITSLAQRSDVAGLYKEMVQYVPPLGTGAGHNDAGSHISAVASHVAHIKAPDAWNEGFRGQGIVVGITDTGARYTHEALVNQYRGNVGGSFDHNYNWFDPATHVGTPNDPHGHGTHVTGSVVGDNGTTEQIGTAPEAQWVSCQACNAQGQCPTTSTIGCAQFMAAPSDVNGNNPDPDLRVHVSSNSLGDCAQSYNGYFQQYIDAYIAAGIIPVYANGNASNCGYSAPPGRNTVGNVGRYGSVLGIGSSGNSNGQYAAHSNWGPTDNPNDGTNPALPDPMGHFDLKPNVIAPGVNIRSSVPNSDAAYGGSTGTSMSTPVASGVIALMLSAAPNLIGDYHTIGTLLMQTANPIPYDSGGGEGPGLVPNYAAGWGEIDAYEAAMAANAASGPRGTLAGKVTADGSGLPIAGATVHAVGQDEDATATTDSSGNYSLNLAVDSYEVEFTAFGYHSVSESNVDIADESTTTLNVSMTAAGSYQVSGVVSDDTTGWPLHAAIEISNYSGGTIYTDPSDGSYSVTLPEGMAFEFSVAGVMAGYEFETRTVGPLAGDATENFDLSADQLSCDAPGYSNASTPILSESFDATTMPAGWAVEDYLGNGAVWAFDNPGSRANETGGGTGNFAIADSDFYGSALDQDTGLITPTFDLSSAANAELHFAYDMRYVWDASAYVDVSVDGGSSWSTEWSLQNQGSRNSSAIVSLADYLGESSVQVRFRYEGSWDYWWQVDDVEVITSGSCTPLSGELLTGVVLDGNTQGGLNGATVEVDGTAYSATTSTDPNLGDGAYYLFVPAGSQDVTASYAGYTSDVLSDTFVDGESRVENFELGAGRLSTLPSALTQTVTFGETATAPFILINDGNELVDVDLQVMASGLDEKFEGAFPPAGWTVENYGGDCVWVRNDTLGKPNYAGGDGFAAAADADSCGVLSWVESGLISPSFQATAASSLDFVMSLRVYQMDILDIDVTTDGGNSWTTIQSYSTSISPTGPGTAQSIDLSAFAGQEIQVRFYYTSDWGYWAQIDDVEVGGNVDWLDVSPDDGVFVTYSTLNTTATFDAGAPSITEPGTYHAVIAIINDTPYGTLEVPVTMIVEPNTSQAEIAGTITGLGYCDSDPQSLAGATVEVVGALNSYTLTTNAAGEFETWLDTAESPVTISVQASGHLGEVVGGVALIGGGTVQQDMDLRVAAPCADFSPDSIAVAHQPGETSTHSITLDNSGAIDLEWDTDTANAMNARQSTGPSAGLGIAPAGAAVNLSHLYTGELQTLQGFGSITAIDCETADYLVITDGGSVENGYSANPDTVAEFSAVQYYEPAAYPAMLGEVCMAFITNGSATSLTFELVAFEDAGGVPGAELGAVTGTVDVPALSGLPAVPLWGTVDGSAMGLSIDSGGIFVGVRYQPGHPADPSPANIFLSVDDESPLPVQLAYAMYDDGGGSPTWAELTGQDYDGFVSLLVRPQLMPATGCVNPEAISWLSVSPASGVTAADGGSSTITVDIDASGLVPGSYEAEVCVITNDPGAPLIGVPVSLTVDSPAHFGTIAGNVESLGYCSADPQPAAGATLEFTTQGGSYTVIADANGDYAVAIDSDESPADISVSFAGHFPASESGVVISAGDTTTVDFQLELDASCAVVTPGSMSDSLEVGSSSTQTLSLANAGAGDLDWTAFTSEVAGIVTGGVQGQAGAGVGLSHPDAASNARNAGLFDLPALDAFTRITAIDCDNAPDLVIHDGGDIDNGYSANAAVVYEVTFVEHFEPAVYPALLGEVCVSFISLNTGPVNQAYELVVFADDGPGGAPGTELGAVTATAENIPGGGLPASIPWFTADLSSLNITVSTGGVYVGVRFDPAVPDSTFIASDESSAKQTGYWRPVGDSGDAWEPIEAAYDNYKALFIRVQMPAATGCMNPTAVSWLSLDPSSGTVAGNDVGDIDVTADATGLAVGQYEAVICIDTNDPDQGLFEVPYSLEVFAPDVIFQDRFEQ